MKTSSLILLVLAVVLSVSLVCIWFYPSIQDFMAGNKMWNGIHDFSREQNVATLDSLDSLPSGSGNVLIEIPYTVYDSAALEQIQSYVSRGNTLVLMDDLGYGNNVLEYLDLPARFNHALLLDPLFCYKNPYLPRITTFSPSLVAAGVQAVAFNHGSFLDSVESSAVIAWSSSESFADANANGVRDPAEAAGPLPVAAEYSLASGRVVLVSDPSLIINTMIGQNDNYLFMQALISGRGTPEVVQLDQSHLSLTPLDSSQANLAAVRKILVGPYVLILLVALAFLLVAHYSFRKGDLIG